MRIERLRSLTWIALAVFLALGPSAAASAAPPGYVIITSQEIRDLSTKLTSFAAHKASRGFTVTIFDESDWGGVGLTDDAAAEALRGFLQTIDGPLGVDYVLIIGDPRLNTGPVPMKAVYPRNQNAIGTNPSGGSVVCGFAQELVPSDYYYAELDGDWDLNGNGKYGEFGQYDAVGTPTGDFGPGGVERNYDIAVGRIPVYKSTSNPSLLANGIVALDSILQKTIDYQNTPLAGIAWRKSALIAIEGANRFFYGEQVKDDILDPNGFTSVYRVYDADTCYTNVPQTCNPPLTSAPDALTCSIANTTAGWLAEPRGMVTWFTHGSGSGAAAITNTSQALLLDNDYPSITWQASCYNSLPSNTNNISYALLKDGAIATLGATRVSHGPGSPVDLQNDPGHHAGIVGMGYWFWERVIYQQDSVGNALMGVKQDNTLYGRCWYWQNYTGFNLYGDPEISIYSHAIDAVPSSSPGVLALLTALLAGGGLLGVRSLHRFVSRS